MPETLEHVQNLAKLEWAKTQTPGFANLYAVIVGFSPEELAEVSARFSWDADHVETVSRWNREFLALR